MQDEPTSQTSEQSGRRVPFYYFNGFELGASLSDFSLMLMVDGQPQSRLSLSFTTAKSLVAQLSEAVEYFEKATDQKLLTMSDVEAAFKQASSEKNA